MSTQKKPTIVFCHGIWADGSCFSKVIPALQADGHEVIAVQYGLDSFEEDVATVKRTLNRVGSPVLLVGHSYGGATITAAGVDKRVAGLVYIAAVAPDVEGRSWSSTDWMMAVGASIAVALVLASRHFARPEPPPTSYDQTPIFVDGGRGTDSDDDAEGNVHEVA